MTHEPNLDETNYKPAPQKSDWHVLDLNMGIPS